MSDITSPVFKCMLRSYDDLRPGDLFVIGSSRWEWDGKQFNIEGGGVRTQTGYGKVLAGYLLKSKVPVERSLIAPEGYSIVSDPEYRIKRGDLIAYRRALDGVPMWALANGYSTGMSLTERLRQGGRHSRTRGWDKPNGMLAVATQNGAPSEFPTEPSFCRVSIVVRNERGEILEERDI